ncbi:MAG: chloride channel protein [Rhodospirillaceae bacterium]|nr:chloride channel protein [Rhodospirillaceae bacterium]MYH37774.1 chloride channel protein [Rhodospirillaceae bacterium]MYK15351.1 chloride channel protein [Rhodospirillaceae bacterium]
MAANRDERNGRPEAGGDSAPAGAGQRRLRRAVAGETRARLAQLARGIRGEEMQIALLALLVGGLAGYAAVGFRLLIGWIQFLFYGESAEKLFSAAQGLPWWQVLLAPAACGLLVGLFIRYLMPNGRPQGVADVIESAALHEGRMSLRHVALASLANAASIGGGASVGREGPVVLLGAGLASAVGKRLGYSRGNMLTLLGCGVASAVAASFNAPLAGALFALEVVVGHYRLKAFAPVVMASVTGTIVSRIHFGDFPAFIKPQYTLVSFWEFPAFALLGVTAAVAAVAMMGAIIAVSYGVTRSRVPAWGCPAIAGLAVGAIALLFPQVLGVGYEATDRALNGEFGLWLLFGIIVAKIAATGLSIGSGFGGGVFSPSLMLGAMVGAAFGTVAASIFPELASDRGAYTLVGMGAVSGAVLGAPISTILIIFELTGDYKVTLGVMFAVVIASVIARAVFGRSFFHWQLGQRGVMAEMDPAEQTIRRTTMADLAQTAVPAMNEACSVADARTMLIEVPDRPVYVVDDDGRLRGWVGLADLFAFGFDAAPSAGGSVEHVMDTPPFLLESDNVDEAMQVFSRTAETMLPVVSSQTDRVLRGEVRQRDVMVAYRDAHRAARDL